MSRILLIILTFIPLAGCGVTPVDQIKINEVCSKVTNENWFTPMRGELSTSEACHQSSMNILDGQIPCTLGGLPGWCRVQRDGGISYHRGISPNWLDIHASEVSLTEGHLNLIR